MRAALFMAVGCASQSLAASGSERVLIEAQYSLAAGEEKYLCFTTTLQADTAIAAFKPTYGTLVHHLVLSYTTSPEPAGTFECPIRSKPTWIPIFEAGRESGSLSLPPNTVMRFRGEQLLMQLHLVNAGKSPISEKTSITLEQNPDASQRAGIYGFDNRVFRLEPKSRASAEMTCTMARDMNVFALLGHMHARGERIVLTRNGSTLYETPWSFDVQPTTPISLSIKKGDVIGLKCMWNNESDKAVVYGDSANDEMCSLIWYYTPYEALDGCAKAE
jgi:hypothetical protein